MATNAYSVNLSDLKKAGDSLKSHSENMKNQLNNFSLAFETLQTCWKGNAAREFKLAFEKASANFPAFYNRVNQYADFLMAAESNYRNSDQ